MKTVPTTDTHSQCRVTDYHHGNVSVWERRGGNCYKPSTQNPTERSCETDWLTNLGGDSVVRGDLQVEQFLCEVGSKAEDDAWHHNGGKQTQQVPHHALLMTWKT